MINIPTTSELYERIANDLRNRLGLTDTQFKTVLDAFASNQAGEIKLLYLFLSDIQKNLFPDTADSESVGGTLEHFGRIYLNREPNPATTGEFEVTVTGTIGSVLRANLGFKSDTDSKNPNQFYLLEDEYTLTSASDTITIVSDGDGSNFDLSIGDTLTITEPVTGVDQTVTITNVLTQPLDSETLDDYREEILLAIQLEPQGGSKTDYRLWSADAQGVRNVYPYVKDGEAGTVQVYVEATLSDSSDGYGTPTTSILDDVEDVINFDPDETKVLNNRGRKPIQVNLEVVSISLVPIDIIIGGLQNQSTEVTESIYSNLESSLYDVRPFVDAADLLRNKNDILYLAKVQGVVSGVLTDGNFFTSFEMYVDGTEKNSHEFSRQNIPYLRNVTYI